MNNNTLDIQYIDLYHIARIRGCHFQLLNLRILLDLQIMKA
jgi:hypothetical protein